MSHPAILSGETAVISGGASGIGLAIARYLAGQGMRVAILDWSEDALGAAETAIREAGASNVLALRVDVSDRKTLHEAALTVAEAMDTPTMLFANAGIGVPTAILGDDAPWDSTLSVNLLGLINTVRAFAPAMARSGKPGAIVCTGSKQGITTPPGNPAYNVSKAGVKAFTEALSYELRNTEGCAVSAHLLIPGFVFTGLTAGDRTEKPAAAWTPEETADFMFERLDAGDFYILCPDNDVPRALDEKRMAWAAGDIIENRPALSRWHPDWTDAFERHVKG